MPTETTDTSADIDAADEAPQASDPSPDAAAPAATLDGRFAVPISIELEATSVPIAQLQAMRTGSVVPLDSDSGEITVRILASGKPFARGTLVAVGDGYGVLIGE